MSHSPHEEQSTVWTEDAQLISNFLTAIGEHYLLQALIRKGMDPDSYFVEKEREHFRGHSLERFLNGFDALFKRPEDVPFSYEETESKSDLARAALQCKKELEARTVEEFICQHLQGQVSLRKVLKIADRTMQHCYRLGYDLLKQERYDEAADFFWLLASLDSFVSVYWLGLGIAEQHRERFKEAIYAYTMATISDETNPLPQFRSAQCYTAIGDLPLAKNSLELSIAQCEGNPKFATLKEQALAWKEKLS